MDGEPAGGTKLIQELKVQLIDALSGEPDLVLQHCHSSGILTQREYDHVKASTVPSDQARDILDYVMKKDRKHVWMFLNLLKSEDIQQAFPKLAFLNNMNLRAAVNNEIKRKQELPEIEVPPKKQCKTKSKTVTEKQLMQVARYIGKNWKEVGRVALEISNTKLEQIMEENPHNHREQVFHMLWQWSIREREKALATRLHELLSQEECAIAPGSIDFLLKDS
ncbi:uncharacterized protein zgc:174906 [Trichomycterus rosablanca]|uniref:uncharacterized protein zgc:174906 n=1 Tax=Trichomycterus rosablanca TaxID=2290929 RepID=UPI002F354BD1